MYGKRSNKQSFVRARQAISSARREGVAVLNSVAKAERLYFALPEAIRRQDRHGIYKALAAELDRIDREERTPMTDSALVQEVRQAISAIGEVRQYSAEGCLIKAASRLCDEFELIQQKIKQA